MLISCLTFRKTPVNSDAFRKRPIVNWRSSDSPTIKLLEDGLGALDTSTGSLATTNVNILPCVPLSFEFFVQGIVPSAYDTTGAIFSFEQAYLTEREQICVILHPYTGGYFAVNNNEPLKQISLTGQHHVLISISQLLSGGSVRYYRDGLELFGSSRVFVFIDGQEIYNDFSQAPLGTYTVPSPRNNKPVQYIAGFSQYARRNGAEKIANARCKGSSALFREFRYYCHTGDDAGSLKVEEFTPPTLLSKQQEQFYRNGDIISADTFTNFATREETLRSKTQLPNIQYPEIKKGTIIQNDFLSELTSAINTLEQSFSNNCCESRHCQSCQSIGLMCQNYCKDCSDCEQCRDCTV